jgi:signal transduction histidine kinase
MTELEQSLIAQELPRGLAVVCGRDGVIQRVLRDDLGMLGDATGKRLTAIVDKSSVEKAQRFVLEALGSGAAFDWELGVPGDRTVRLLHFAASVTGEDSIVVVGAPSRSAVVRYYDELMEVNNEQANALRAALKANSARDRDAGVYDEMMRLNNELATVQRELTKKNLELERANQLKNQFLGTAAHDLRNPIGAIRSYSQLLLDAESPVPEEQRRAFLERIEASSEFMLALINDLLDLSAIESGQVRVDARDLDIAQLVRENVELNRLIAREKRIGIELDVEPGLPHIRADAQKIEQILNNLLGNAVKFAAPGTVVQVRARAGNGGVWLMIVDQGPGIPHAERTTIFRPFQRGTGKATAGEPSTGLGLAIVKRLVDGHGGRIEFESEVGRGTTFSVWLPLTQSEEGIAGTRG